MIPEAQIEALLHGLEGKLGVARALASGLDDQAWTMRDHEDAAAVVTGLRRHVLRAHDELAQLARTVRTAGSSEGRLHGLQGLVHDLGTPLTGALACCAFLRDLGEADDPSQRETLRALGAVLHATSAAKEYGRTLYGGGSSISSLRELLVAAVPHRSSALRLDISPAPIFDALVANRFVWAFLDEAITNAWKHAPGAEVSIHANAHPDHVEISVADTGPGFDPSTVRRGAGLGVLQDSAAALGGDLLIEERPTRITLRFPLEV